MGDISEHFSLKEFRCNCRNDCGFEAVDHRLLLLLEKIRNYFNKPVNVHCINRCPAYNREKRSKDTSQHIRGLAADIHIKGVSVNELAEYADILMPNSGGIGKYYNWNNPGIHIDVRSGKMARWTDV